MLFSFDASSSGRAKGETQLTTIQNTAQDLRDCNSQMNEHLNTVLHLYLDKRTQVLDELMGRELWAVRESARSKREQIQAVLDARAKK